MKTWIELTRSSPGVHPYTPVWVCRERAGVRLRRVPRPIVDGSYTGGWWVLYRYDTVLATFEYRRDQWRKPPRTWANKVLG